ncbi:hypothetical protein BDW74DRAFT_189306 [Aspergillus multicolor]|uniref:putative mitochondrial inner membrane protease subunit Imp2 n=1 Tax=Aspergillus multicolor TaxID=41759 RepID=UPI003CCD11EF
MAQPPKYRILSPEAAKSRVYTRPDPLSNPPKQPPTATPPSHPPTPTSSTTSTSTPKATPKPRFPFFTLAHLRNLYARTPRFIRLPLRTVGRVWPIFPIVFFIPEYVAQIREVSGPSMTPYLNPNHHNDETEKSLVFIKMWPGLSAFKWGVERQLRIERGMLVAFRSPHDTDNIAIKRVVGLPGDKITTLPPCAKPSQIVPWGHVWVEGDNPKKTIDSNAYGPVSVSLIMGNVTAILRPEFRWVNWEEWESGNVDGGRFGADYRKEARDRVEKEAVKLQQPFLT